jgi:diadenosine tetraphosphate (Ap4A) HIT family hydrolase
LPRLWLLAARRVPEIAHRGRSRDTTQGKQHCARQGRGARPGRISLVHATGAVAWQTVFHFHLHLVPRRVGDGLVPPWPLDQPRAEDASLRAIADKLRSAG